jgi:hypothetical protein
MNRPLESLLSVAAWRATTQGRRRASGVTIVPSRIRWVAWAIAPRVVQGSTIGIASVTEQRLDL